MHAPRLSFDTTRIASRELFTELLPSMKLKDKLNRSVVLQRWRIHMDPNRLMGGIYELCR
jgi:hypothetical protein